MDSMLLYAMPSYICIYMKMVGRGTKRGEYRFRRRGEEREKCDCMRGLGSIGN